VDPAHIQRVLGVVECDRMVVVGDGPPVLTSTS